VVSSKHSKKGPVIYVPELTYHSSIGYYLPFILQTYVGLSPKMARILAAVGSCQYLFFSILPIWFIERVGRRRCMIWGGAALSIICALICVGFNIKGSGGPVLITTMYFLFYDVFGVR